jgi:Zn-finger nucleic acid-binding protein/DNA-directed RNA polymerase subunit RPC12/RpoP
VTTWFTYSMNCSNCSAEMISMDVEAHLSAPLTIDLCSACQGLWFDKYESLKLSPASTLKLMKWIGEHPAGGKITYSNAMKCPRCSSTLRNTNDIQRSTRFSYWRCPQDHGRFIRFFEFLKEKDFIRPLSAEQIADLKLSVQSVNCSSCGAPIDLAATSTCTHCGAALSMLDMRQPQQMIAELQKAAEPKPIDPDLPLKLAEAKRLAEAQFGPDGASINWSNGISGSGLVHAGLNALAHWMTESGL